MAKRLSLMTDIEVVEAAIECIRNQDTPFYKHIISRLRALASPPRSIFRAGYYFRDQENSHERNGDFYYLARDEKDAVDSFVRWWKGRQKCLPEIFHRLYCVKITREVLPKINEKGSFVDGSNGLGQIYEWKCDWPKPNELGVMRG